MFTSIHTLKNKCFKSLFCLLLNRLLEIFLQSWRLLVEKPDVRKKEGLPFQLEIRLCSQLNSCMFSRLKTSYD